MTPRTGSRGSVSLIALSGALILTLTALGAADLGSLLHGRARAQAAADAAALAAAVAQIEVLGHADDPEAVAREVAAANGAVLDGCACEPGATTAEVRVSVHPRLVFIEPWFGRAVWAQARAAVDPDVLSYRDDG